MNTKEQALLEAIGSLFKNNPSKLGIVPKKYPEVANCFNYQWNLIEEMFALKTLDCTCHESLTAAFYDIHSYKYINDPTFPIALEKRLTAVGVPTEARQLALKVLNEILLELKPKKGDFEEKEAGWHPELKEILDMTQNANNREYENTKPYTGGGPAPDPDEIK